MLAPRGIAEAERRMSSGLARFARFRMRGRKCAPPRCPIDYGRYRHHPIGKPMTQRGLRGRGHTGRSLPGRDDPHRGFMFQLIVQRLEAARSQTSGVNR